MARYQRGQHPGSIQSCSSQVLARKILLWIIQIRRPRAQGLLDYFITRSKFFSEHPRPTDILSQPDGRFLILSRGPSPGVGIAENKNSFWAFGSHKIILLPPGSV